jgi:hypothetical protein
MEPERVWRGGRPVRGMFFGGFLSGVLASLLALAILACKYGPRGESREVDLYSGRMMTQRYFLWKRSHIPGPEEPHVRWAIEHQNPVRSWYVFVCGMSRAEWFGHMMAVDTFRGDHVLPIYRLPLPEEEKVKLLHQYHEELDALKVRQEEWRESGKFMERFHQDWEQRLKKLAQDGQPLASPK